MLKFYLEVLCVLNIHVVDENQIVLSEVADFDLAETFNCGQCFRWNPSGDNEFVGVAFDCVVNILKKKNKIVLTGKSMAKNFDTVWQNYFDLDSDYSKVKAGLSSLDATLSLACKYAPGIRILQQDPWEALCSFIISQNNNIPRIKGIIERLCRCFGREVEPGFFSFPKIITIAKLDKDDLSPIKCGFRDAYILDAAQKVASGEVDFAKIARMPLDSARKELMKIKGVGPKVAECALLYGFHRLEAFPIDVWMQRALDTFFPGKDISYFGRHAGIAQQYIFHYSRMNPSLVK